MNELSEFERNVSGILEKKLAQAGLDPTDDNLTIEEISQIEEFTKESQDEAREL